MSKISLGLPPVLLLAGLGCIQICDGARPGISLVVVDDQGAPVHETDIEVKDKLGVTVLQGTIREGRFEIADLGFGPHSIAVGRKDRCAAVELKNVFFSIHAHSTFRIVLNPCPQQGDSFGSGCSVYFRVRNAKSGPVTGAFVTGRTTKQSVITDSYGRATAIIGAHSAERFLIQAAGYKSEEIPLECKWFGKLEKEVVLSGRDQ